MDQEQFQRALWLVLAAGTLIAGAGGVTLYVILKRFEGAKPNIGLMGGLLVFIFLVCAALFALSYAQ